MKTYFLLLFLFLPFLILGQSDEECARLLDKPLAFDMDTKEWDQELFLEDAALLLQCYFDSLDQAILSDKAFFNFLILLSARDWDHHPTNLDMLEYFQKVQRSKDFRDQRAGMEGPKTFGNTISDTLDWEQDKLLIGGFQPSDALLDSIYVLAVEYQGQGKTYGELIDMYRLKVDARPKPIDPFDLIDGNTQVFAYEEGLKKAREENKPLLIYFSGYAVINCLKMEDQVLSDLELQEYLLAHYVCLKLDVDDRTDLEPAFRTPGIRRVGQRNAELQKRFQPGSLPYFVILAPDETTLGQTGYTLDLEAFMGFLESGVDMD
ncbi:MAG: thioredoxin family protein [Saprospiraceae bacterium]|nr:thioredoxin family protein [Saprospiraceae bacterium]